MPYQFKSILLVYHVYNHKSTTYSNGRIGYNLYENVVFVQNNQKSGKSVLQKRKNKVN